MTNLRVLREQTLFHLICRITEINGHLGQIMEVTAQTPHTSYFYWDTVFLLALYLLKLDFDGFAALFYIPVTDPGPQFFAFV